MNRRNNTRLIGGVIFFVLLIGLVSVYAIRQSAEPQTVSLPAQSAVTCKTPQHSLGDSTDMIYSAALKRSFLVHLPPSYGRQPQPLVLTYHGYSWTAQIMEHNTKMDVEADKAGFVLVFPQGVDDPPSWNAGVGAYGPTGDANDLQFTRDMLKFLKSNYCVDTHRVYVAGFSLGGGMVYRLACVLSDQIAAVASVSGAYYPLPEGCHPTRALPILEIHGAADQLAPYDGNASRDMEAVQDYLHGWLERDKCNNIVQMFFQRGDVTGTEWTHCANGVIVRHYRVSDGGHTWPGSPNTTHVIDANVVIWQFFSQFSR
ncbi:MAG: dienelactone hydrolase family protein [Ktedonobacteraceae bacterium]|nr:dienelactone hydrolase family protein [Ktedonobacteraceae bacterium]